MTDQSASGYLELPHTADWALQVWGPDEAALLAAAAAGMYDLMGATLQPGSGRVRRLQVDAPDAESRLVTFLSELLYLGEQEGLAFDRVAVTVRGERVIAALEGAPLLSVAKEIKAVTYHNLVIRQGPRGLETVIVFDV